MLEETLTAIKTEGGEILDNYDFSGLFYGFIRAPECLQITKTPKTQALAPSRSSPQSEVQAAKCLEDKDQDLQFNFFFFLYKFVKW